MTHPLAISDGRSLPQGHDKYIPQARPACVQSSGLWATGDSGNHCGSKGFPDSLSIWDPGLAGDRRPRILTRDKAGAVSTVDRTGAAIRMTRPAEGFNRTKHLT